MEKELPRPNIAWGLLAGEDKSGSETAYEYEDADEEDENDNIDEDFEIVSKYCLLTAWYNPNAGKVLERRSSNLVE